MNWKNVAWSDECPNCGCGIEVKTDCSKPNFAYDGDEARCTDCHKKGWVSVGEDSAYVDWTEIT